MLVINLTTKDKLTDRHWEKGMRRKGSNGGGRGKLISTAGQKNYHALERNQIKSIVSMVASRRTASIRAFWVTESSSECGGRRYILLGVDVKV